MKNKTGGDRRLSETDEEATVIEDQVRPGKLYCEVFVFEDILNIVTSFCLRMHENQISKHARYPDMIDIGINVRARTIEDR